MEEKLTSDLGKGQITEFIEDNQVEARQIVSKAALPAGASLGFESIDQIDDVEETATRSAANAGARDGDGKMRLAGSSPSDEDDIALLGDEVATYKITDQALIDRCIGKGA